MSFIKNVLFGLGAAALAFSSVTAEAAWPERPVTVLTSYAPGAVNDLLIRQVSSMLNKELGQPFLIVNQAGNGGNLCINNLMQAPKDGYTIGASANNIFGYNIYTMKVRYAFEDLVPVSLMSYSCMAVISNPEKGWKTVKDAFAAAKAEKRPLKVAVMDNLSRDICLAMGKQEGVQIAPIPQKGGTPTLSAVMGNHADLGLVGTIAIENTKAGKVNTIASASSKRFTELPDVPTLHEQGYATTPIYEAQTNIFVMKGVPDEVVDTLSKAMIKISQTPEYAETLKTLSLEFAPMGKENAQKAVEAENKDKAKLFGK